jgi:hypothetical protein
VHVAANVHRSSHLQQRWLSQEKLQSGTRQKNTEAKSDVRNPRGCIAMHW